MHSDAVQNLIDQLGRLPGIGPKSAQRVAYHLLNVPKEDALALATAISTAKERVRFCEVCHNCLLYTSPSPRDLSTSRMPSSA